MADDIVVVEFYSELDANGNPVDYVRYGERFSVATQVATARVSDIDPAKLRSVGSVNQRDMKRAFFEHRWRQIEPAYKAWKDGNEMPEHGTPIDYLPGLNRAQLQALRGVGFKSVEDIAEAPDGALSRIPLPNKQELKTRAIDFLKARETGKATQELDGVKAQLAEAVAMIAELKADKPKRGRKPKNSQFTENVTDNGNEWPLPADETENEEAA